MAPPTRNAHFLPIEDARPPKLPPSVRRSPTAVNLSKTARLTLVVRSRGSDKDWQRLVAELTSGLPGQRRYLTRAEFAQQWSASPEDMEAVRKFAERQGLTVVSSDPVRRCVVVSGSLRQISRTFAVDFYEVNHPLGTFRTYRGAARIRRAMHPLVVAVLGLHDLPCAKPHVAAAAAGHGMDRRALLAAYEIPSRLRGKGQCVAVVECGGGFYKRDLRSYFERLRLPLPPLRKRTFGGARNDPAPRKAIREFVDTYWKARIDPSKPAKLMDPATAMSIMWTMETTMDLALVGTIAPEATLLLLQTSNDDQGQYHAITSAITDAANAPSVLSCSWGDPEATQSHALMRTLNHWFQAAAVLGISVFCASGDNGDGTLNAKLPKKQTTLTVQFPASSPYVMACGGTTLRPKAGTEVAWEQNWCEREMASGGGFSAVFPLPRWQRAAGIRPGHWIPRGTQSGRGRALPDIAAKANLDDAYCVIVGGVEAAAGGTSFAAPLWAGLSAVLNQGLRGRIGSLQGPLYDGALRESLRPIVAGSTGCFHASKGWNACTGWGSPRGKALLRTLRG